MDKQEYMGDYIKGKKGSWGARIFFKCVIHCLIISLVVLGMPLPPIPRIAPEHVYEFLRGPSELANKAIDTIDTITEKVETKEAEAVQVHLVQDVGESTVARTSFVGSIDDTQDFDTVVDTSKSLIFPSWKTDYAEDHSVSGNTESGGEGVAMYRFSFGGTQSIVAQRNMIEPNHNNTIGASTIGAYVVEFGDSAATELKKFAGGTVMLPGTLEKEITLPEPIAADKSFVTYTRAIELAHSTETETTTPLATLYKADSNTPDGYVDTLKLKRSQLPTGYMAFKISHAAPPMNIEYQIAELDSRVKVQSGTAQIAAGSTSTTDSLTALAGTDKAFLVFNSSGGADTDGVEGLIFVRGTISSTTQLTFTRGGSGSGNDHVDISWFVVEFTDGTRVIKGTTSTITGLTSSPSWTGAVDLERSFPVISTSISSSSTHDAQSDLLFLARINANGTQLDLSRNTSNTDAVVDWFVVELSPLTLKVPDDGLAPNDVWYVGDTYEITWEHADSIATTDTVALEIDTGSGYETTDLTCAEGTYVAGDDICTWRIPEYVGTTLTMDTGVKIKVEDTTLSTNYDSDESENTFEIRGKINIVKPDQNSLWFIDDTEYVEWTFNGDFGTMDIEVDGGQGGGWQSITGASGLDIDNGPCTQGTYGSSGSNCSWLWTVEDYPYPTVQMRIKSTTNANYTDIIAVSDTFEIRPSVEVVEPASGVEWLVGRTHRIEWTSSGTLTNVKIKYNPAGTGYVTPPGMPVSVVAYTGGDCPASRYCYDWAIDPSTTLAASAKVKVESDTSPDVNDPSDDFSLIPSLSLDEPLTTTTLRVYDNVPATKVDIVWSHPESPVMSNIGIKYTTNYALGGSPCKDELTNHACWLDISVDPGESPGLTGNSASPYQWEVPSTAIGEDIGIRIFELGNEDLVFDDDGQYTVKGSIVIVSPTTANVGKTGSLRAGGEHTIDWTAYGDFGDVYIFLSTNNAASYDVPIVDGNLYTTNGGGP